MEIKRIRKLKINAFEFKVIWDKSLRGASVDCIKREIRIGTKNADTTEIFERICHELWEIGAMDMGVRLSRPDCDSDYIFVYDHRQHDTMCNMVAGWLAQFIK